MRKTIQLPAEIDTLLSEYLKDVESKQGIKISKSSWVTQAIREKMDKDSKLMVPQGRYDTTLYTIKHGLYYLYQRIKRLSKEILFKYLRGFQQDRAGKKAKAKEQNPNPAKKLLSLQSIICANSRGSFLLLSQMQKNAQYRKRTRCSTRSCASQNYQTYGLFSVRDSR